MIKPLSIGRGDGPLILEDLLKYCPVKLIAFREWPVCSTTWSTLVNLSKGTAAEDDVLADIKDHKNLTSWCLVLEHQDGSDPTEKLLDYCGPPLREKWERHHLRMRYSSYRSRGAAAHPLDSVVYIAPPEKRDLIRLLLFG